MKKVLFGVAVAGLLATGFVGCKNNASGSSSSKGKSVKEGEKTSVLKAVEGTYNAGDASGSVGSVSTAGSAGATDTDQQKLPGSDALTKKTVPAPTVAGVSGLSAANYAAAAVTGVKVASISNWAAVIAKIKEAKGGGSATVEANDFTLTITDTTNNVTNGTIDPTNGDIKANIAQNTPRGTFTVKVDVNAVAQDASADPKVPGCDAVTGTAVTVTINS